MNRGSITRVARPKSITDERLLKATGDVISREGPDFTMAQVAAEAKVSVGTLAVRFGSKSGLLQALSRREITQVGDRMRAAAEGLPPLEGLRAALTSWFFEGAPDPATAGNHLAQLGVDLMDPALRALLADLHVAIETALRDLVAAVDLPGAPEPGRAARVLHALVSGATLDWSIRPDGGLVDRMLHDVDAVLDAWGRP